MEDAIALRLVNESGSKLEALPPGKIYGMTVTEPCQSPPPPPQKRSTSPIPIFEIDKKTSKGDALVSQNAIEMLAQLFPHRKRSVLELILRRCDSDLLRAIEQCSRPAGESASAFKPPSLASQVGI